MSCSKVNPGDLVWVAPDTALYPVPSIAAAGDADIESTIDWSLALLIAEYDFWCMLLIGDVLRFVGKHSLMSSIQVPSSVLNR